MKALSYIRAIEVVSKWELRKNLRSRKTVALLVAFLVLVFLAIPIAFYSAQSSDAFDVLPFWHIVGTPSNASAPTLALYLLSAWGAPVPNYPVTLTVFPGSVRAQLSTDSRGELLYPLSPNASYELRIEHAQYPFDLALSPNDLKVPASTYDIRVAGFYDLDFDLRAESQLIHAVRSADGLAASNLAVYRNNTFQGFLDPNGYYRVILPEGLSSVQVRNSSMVLLDLPLDSFPGSGSPALPFRQGPSYVFAYLWSTLVGYLVPLVSIPLGIEAISSELSYGTIELLRVRPLPRTALGFGKICAISLTLLTAACVAGTGVALFASVAFGALIPIQVILAFVAGTTVLGTIYALIAMLTAVAFRAKTNSYTAAVIAWLLFGPGWVLLGLSTSRIAGFANPYLLSTRLVSLAMPNPVVAAWSVFLPRSNSVDVLIGLLAWFGPLICLVLVWWSLSRMMRSSRRNHQSAE